MAEYKAQKVTNREVQNAQHAAWPHSVKAPKPMKVSDKEVKKAQHEAWPHSYPAPKPKRTTSDGYMPKRTITLKSGEEWPVGKKMREKKEKPLKSWGDEVPHMKK